MANNNLNYNYFNAHKYFINKIWNEDITNNYDKGLNNLNSSFNEILNFNVNIEENSNGRFFDDMFNNDNFGVRSLRKIQNIDFMESQDKYFLIDTINNKNILNINTELNTINRLESNKIYKYNITVKNEKLYTFINDIYNSKITYQIEIFDKKFKNNELLVTDINFSNDSLEFYDNNFIEKPENISVITKEEYYIIDIKDYGNVYDFLLEYDLEFRKNITFTYQNQKIYYIEKKMENNRLRYIFTDLDYDTSTNFISIELLILITSFNFFENNTYLKFLDISKNFFFIDSSSNYDVYIKINDILYLLEYDYDLKLFYINDNIFSIISSKKIDSFTNQNIITNIFKYVKILDIRNVDYKYAFIKFNRKLNNYIDKLQTDFSIGSNITSLEENLIIKGINTDNETEIYIKYTYDKDINSMLFKPLILNYRLKESINYFPRSIKKINKFLYKIKNNYKFSKDEVLNFDLRILYDFNDDTIESSVIICELFEISKEEIKFFVPLSDSLLNYNNNVILKNDEIINNSFLKVYKNIDISNNILLDRVLIKQIFDNSRLYLIFELDDNFIFSHYYKLANEIILINNDIVNLEEKFKSINILDIKFATELIGEFLWNSEDTFSFKTIIPQLIRNREITINYEASFLKLTSKLDNSTLWENDGTCRSCNLKKFIKNENLKIFNLNNKNYGIIRTTTTGDNTFENDFIKYKSSNNKNLNLELKIDLTFPLDSEYSFNKDEFDQSVSNITTTKIKFTRQYDNLVSLLLLTNSKNYNYKLLFETEDGNIVLNILNTKIFFDRIEIELDDEIFIDNFFYDNYKLIEIISEKEIKKNEYFEVYELQLNENIPIFFNKGESFETQLIWLNNNNKNLPFVNNYFIKYSYSDEWEYTNFMYLSINGLIKDIYIISMVTFFNNNNMYDHYILLSTDENIEIDDNIKLISYNWNKTIQINNFLQLFDFKIENFVKTLFYKYNTDYSKINLLCRFNELNFFDYISNINNNIYNEYNNLIEKSNNRFFMRFKYEDVNLINNSYNNIGLSKINDTIEYNSIDEKEFLDPIWVKDLQLKFFNSIDLLFDDTIIEKVDSNMLRILYNFNFTIFKETSFDKIIRLYKNDNELFFKLPLRLFFNTIYKFLPCCLMKKTKLSIIFNINKLSNLIKNNGTIENENNIKPIIDIYYSTYYLEKKLVNELKEKQKYMLAQVCYNYTNSVISSRVNTIHPKVYNMVKDIFIVVNNVFYNNDDNIKRDNWYSKYIIDYNNYLNNIDEKFLVDKDIFNIINNEIETGSERIDIIESHPLLNQYDIHYILYLDLKYLSYIDENLNNLSSSYSKKITILVLYFKNIFFEEEIQIDNSLEKILFKLNGINISPSVNANYYNDVIPYLKGYSLENDNYVYSFGLNSRNKQPNGHLNLKQIEDFSIEIVNKPNIDKAKLKLYSKEYKIIHFKDDKFFIIN